MAEVLPLAPDLPLALHVAYGKSGIQKHDSEIQNREQVIILI